MTDLETPVYPEDWGVTIPEGFEYEDSGKVRDIYHGQDGTPFANRTLLVATDRVSALNVKIPSDIPGKGVALNYIAARELLSAEMAGFRVWQEEVRDNRVTMGKTVDILPVEMVFRRLITGSMWRKRAHYLDLGFELPDDIKEFDDISTADGKPLCTPTTKDEDDTPFHPDRVFEMTGVTPANFTRMKKIGEALFAHGERSARRRGLVLADTKYEFGITRSSNDLVIADEVHTPDSSRFYEASTFNAAVADGESPEELSKENIRKYLLNSAARLLGYASARAIESTKSDGLKKQMESAAQKIAAQPLPQEVIDENVAIYRALAERWGMAA